MPSETNLIASRYVRALFDLASEGQQHDSVKKDMLSLRAMFAESAELRKFLVNPLVTRANAEKMITALLTAAKACELTSKFFITLARQRRLPLVPVAIDKYLSQLAESRGELTVQVASAKALGEPQIQVLTNALSKSTGKKVTIDAKEDASLIGGVMVKIGSKMFDNTIAGKLARLKIALSKAA
jgi:F-type H+-transporting ATPase subunit delta